MPIEEIIIKSWVFGCYDLFGMQIYQLILAESYETDTTVERLVGDFSSDNKEKVILAIAVTAGSIGARFAEIVSKAQPALIILASISPGIETRRLKSALASSSNVREVAVTFNGWADVSYIDVVVSGAGLMATEYSLTVDGLESQFGTNHLGHLLFTNLTMGKILASKAPHVANITSDGHLLDPIRWSDYSFDHAYSQSKTTIILLMATYSLAHTIGPFVPEGFRMRPLVQGTNLEHNGGYIFKSRVGESLTDNIKPWATSTVEAEGL
ncbi:hypothetical protein M426DRAFT_75588 [Hypoxylon sp. CI-4A]|nr:hypothetical protein M426DRAFT_75588 [Hypoxylon sp. CI-4A]